VGIGSAAFASIGQNNVKKQATLRLSSKLTAKSLGGVLDV
jgi:hypothetical protein